MRSLGYIPDPKDARDYTFRSQRLLSHSRVRSVVEGADYKDMLQWRSPILDQGSIGSCVANAGFKAIQIINNRDGVSSPKLGSRLWGYYIIRAYLNTCQHDSGGHIRDFFKGMNKYGFLSEEEYEFGYDTRKYTIKPSPEMYVKAFDQRLGGNYYRIYDQGRERLTQIDKALANNYPVVFGTDVSDDFCSDRVDYRNVDRPSSQERICGGHAMVCIGKEDGRYIIQNSWGLSGLAGLYYFTKEYMSWYKTRDLWIVAQAPYFG